MRVLVVSTPGAGHVTPLVPIIGLGEGCRCRARRGLKEAKHTVGDRGPEEDLGDGAVEVLAEMQ